MDSPVDAQDSRLRNRVPSGALLDSGEASGANILRGRASPGTGEESRDAKVANNGRHLGDG
jgi:hypothetical protein